MLNFYGNVPETVHANRSSLEDLGGEPSSHYLPRHPRYRKTAMQYCVAGDPGAWTAGTIGLRDSMLRHFQIIARNSAIAPQ